MLKFLVFIIVIFSFSSCFVQNPNLYTANSKIFYEKYKEFIPENEKIEASWYHYVKSIDSNGQYILRTFFPETKVLTSKQSFLDKNCSILNGESIIRYDNGSIESVGKFIKNKKVGEWKFYYWGANTLKLIANYENDKLNGKFEKFDFKGRKSEVLNYKMGVKEGDFVIYDSLGNISNQGEYKSDTIFRQSRVDSTDNKRIEEHMPYLAKCAHIKNKKLREKCTSQKFNEYVYRKLYYPPKAHKYGLEGKALIRFTVNKSGEIVKVSILKGLNQEIKEELLELISNMPKWIPSKQGEKYVSVWFTLPVVFKLH